MFLKNKITNTSNNKQILLGTVQAAVHCYGNNTTKDKYIYAKCKTSNV